jgi:hypothetical protein
VSSNDGETSGIREEDESVDQNQEISIERKQEHAAAERNGTPGTPESESRPVHHLTQPVSSCLGEIVSCGLWASTTDYGKSIIETSVRALKSIARRGNLLDIPFTPLGLSDKQTATWLVVAFFPFVVSLFAVLLLAFVRHSKGARRH